MWNEGGGVYADAGANVTVAGGTFRGNSVHDDYFDGGGGVSVVRCVLYTGPHTTALAW